MSLSEILERSVNYENSTANFDGNCSLFVQLFASIIGPGVGSVVSVYGIEGWIISESHIYNVILASPRNRSLAVREVKSGMDLARYETCLTIAASVEMRGNDARQTAGH